MREILVKKLIDSRLALLNYLYIVSTYLFMSCVNSSYWSFSVLVISCIGYFKCCSFCVFMMLFSFVTMRIGQYASKGNMSAIKETMGLLVD